MPQALIGLGANLGDRRGSLDRAIEALRSSPHIDSLRCSRWRETAPVGGPDGQNRFLNGAAVAHTTLSADQLHALLVSIENRLGRTRHERWSARTIDLDLLLYGDEIIDKPALTVPHPRMAFRRFVLEPAAEVAPEMIHPLIGWSMASLVEHLNTAANYAALVGPPGSGKTAIAECLARETNARLLADPAAKLVAAGGLDPASPALSVQIQFLDARAGLLDRRAWTEGTATAVSDFWFEQSFAYARVRLDPEACAAFDQAARQARAAVVSPKLVVALDLPRRPHWALSQQIGSAGISPCERLRLELARLASAPGHGPVLFVAEVDPQARYAEVAAALEAMK